MTKIQVLAEIEGYEDEYEMLEAIGHDSLVPCICTNRECDYTEELEPDCRNGFCPECKTQTLKSALVLMGMI